MSIKSLLSYRFFEILKLPKLTNSTTLTQSNLKSPELKQGHRWKILRGTHSIDL